jgi:hypothetical protein
MWHSTIVFNLKVWKVENDETSLANRFSALWTTLSHRPLYGDSLRHEKGQYDMSSLP